MKAMIVSIVLILVAGPDASGAELHADIEYSRVGGESVKLDACVPEDDGPFPVAILVHGGGWGGGDKAGLHVPPTEPLTKARFTWFSINYRLAPQHRWPACLEDVQAAIRWVKQHAADYKGDPERIALIGYSAGGHLAAFAAATADDATRVQALVLLAGPTDLEADCERRGGVSPALQALLDRSSTIDDEVRQVLREASPIHRLTAKAPPCLLIHGTVDESVLYSQSQNFKRRLEELGVPCELVTIPGGPHSIERWEAIDSSYQQKMVDWLDAKLSLAP